MTAALLLGLSAPAFAAQVLFSDAEQGVLLVRDAALADSLKASDRLCAAYSQQQELADRLGRRLDGTARRKREHASYVAQAQKLMGECLNAEAIAQRLLEESLGQDGRRIQKASAFEDMALIQLIPEGARHYEALYESRPKRGRGAASFAAKSAPGAAN